MKDKKRIICSGCGGEFDASLPKCPYCDIIHYAGAEAEYLNKLDDIRDDMEELGDVQEDVVKEELKKQGHLVKRIVIMIAVILALLAAWTYFRLNFRFSQVSDKEQFLWQSENYPKFDTMYKAEEYQELADILQKELQGEYSIWDYEHRAFAFVYDNITDAKKAMQLIDSGEDTSLDMYTTLLYNQMDFIIQWERTGELSEEERAIIEPLKGEVVEDFHNRWQMREEDYQKLLKKAEDNYHVLPYKEVEKYVKKWLKEKK